MNEQMLDRGVGMMEAAIKLDTTVVASKNQVSADLVEEVVILSLKNGVYYGLNAVGARIWAKIQQPCVVTQVRDHVLKEYPNVDPDRCTRETLALLEEMVAAEIIDIVAYHAANRDWVGGPNGQPPCASS